MIIRIFGILISCFVFVSFTFGKRPLERFDFPLYSSGSIYSSFRVADDPKPLPRLNYVRSRDFDTKHISLDLKFGWEREQTFGIERFTFSPLKPDFTTLNLDAGSMVFNSVELEDGTELEYSYDSEKSLLTIELDKSYQVGQEITVVIDYQTTGKTIENSLGFGGGGGLKFVQPTEDEPNKPRQIWSQGESEYNRYWFPSYDYPNDFRTTELKATVKKPLSVISNGKLLSTVDNGDTRTFHWKMDSPYTNYLTSIVVGEYDEIRGNYQDIPVSTYVYREWKHEGEVTAKRLPAMVKFFSETLDFKYPFVKYAQTIANEFNGGMENITATTQTDNMIIDARTELDTDFDGLQAHELAHQWFGDYVTCRDWSEIWLNESFATYFEALWQKESKGHDEFLYTEVKGNQDNYLGSWRQGSRRPIVTKYYGNPDSVFDNYAYSRGGAVLHMLHKQLGDENFFRALRHYLKSNANQPVQTEDLRIAIEEATGQSMDAFFDQWLYRMGHPVFEIIQDYDSTTGNLRLTVKQVQKRDVTSAFPQVQYFQTPVDIEIVTAENSTVERVFIEAKQENVYEFELDGKPLLVDFDNEGTLIKEITFEKSLDDLVYQAANDKDVLGRLWAMSELTKLAAADSGSSDTRAQIVALLNSISVSDSSWHLRRAAIGNLRTVLSSNGSAPGQPEPKHGLESDTVIALTKAVSDKNALVRADAIRLLALSDGKKHIELYKRAVLDDKSYSVIDAAAFALGSSGDNESYSILRKLAQTASWRGRLQIAGLSGLAAMKDKRALDLGFKFAIDRTIEPGIRDAAFRVIAAAGKDDPKAFELFFANFKKAAENRSFQTLFSSMQGFIDLADPRGQKAFDELKEIFKNNKNILGFVERQEKLFQAAFKK